MVRMADRVQEAAAELLLGSKQITLVGGLAGWEAGFAVGDP